MFCEDCLIHVVNLPRDQGSCFSKCWETHEGSLTPLAVLSPSRSSGRFLARDQVWRREIGGITVVLMALFWSPT